MGCSRGAPAGGTARGRGRVALSSAVAALLVVATTAAMAPLPASAAEPPVTARGAVLWEPDSQTVIYDRDAAVGRPMASTTKIMTVLLALEAGAIDDEVAVSAAAADVGQVPGGASLGLREGDRLPMRSILAGLMLRSGNDAAVAVAEHVAGSEEAFVAQMNARAAELGMTDTRFVNSSGLTDDPTHRSSPLDLARLAAVAMADADFAAWAAAPELTTDLGHLVSRNELLTRFEGATGVKTGFTSLAGLCLVASATRDGRTLYAVVLGSDDSFGDVAALLAHGFDDHRLIDAAQGPVLDYRWADASVELVSDGPLAATVPAGAGVVRRLLPAPLLERPLQAGERAGETVLLVDGIEVARAPLVAAEAMAPRGEASPASAAGAAVSEALRGLVRLRPIDHDL